MLKEVEFKYKGLSIIIQTNSDEKMNKICQKFATKSKTDIDKIYFVYNGKVLNKDLTVAQLIKGLDKKENKIYILVCDLENLSDSSNSSLIKSKNIICPKCGENACIDIRDYKITLYNCIFGHTTDNILLNEFENTQYIDISEIHCDSCFKNNKFSTYNTEFYKCLSCEMNLCPLCKSVHDKKHNIINFDEKNYKCHQHNELYSSYCKECYKNLCIICENEHEEHEIIYFKKLMNIDEIKENLKKYKSKVEKLNNIIKEPIMKLNKVMECMENYYTINNDLIQNYEIKNRNYEILYNLNEINNNIHIKELDSIINSKDLNIIMNNILLIYNKMTTKEQFSDEITIIYEIKKNKDSIKIFGEDFVNNNKNFCKFICDGKEYDLKETFNVKNYDKDILEIKLKGIMKITDMSCMFSQCSSLISLPDINKWNTINITNMGLIFAECSSLLYLPNISKWNTKNVTNMVGMFYNCSSLLSLSDLHKWNTNNVIKMKCLFYGCLKLKYLSGISDWNTSNVIDMSFMFHSCESLISLTDLSNWDTSKVTYMNSMFSSCYSLKSLPDISKWNTSNVVDMKQMFYECKSLRNLPDISKWNIENVTNKEGMFHYCNESLNIPSKFRK